MDDRSEFQTFALEFRRKAQTAGHPVRAKSGTWSRTAGR
jgi:hypothetical protein